MHVNMMNETQTRLLCMYGLTYIGFFFKVFSIIRYVATYSQSNKYGIAS